jgi:hypothetical protein
MTEREIGSEFWDVPVKKEAGRLFPGTAGWFLSGRSALRAIIRELGDCRSVAMPSWCCDSMIEPFAEAGIRVCFYPVWFDGALEQTVDTGCDALFVMDYFGCTGPRPDLSGYQGVVIRDVTHSLFSAEYDDADFCFGSLRKWCGVWTGGFAWARDGRPLQPREGADRTYLSLRREAMEKKERFLRELAGSAGAAEAKGEYLRLFAEAEERLERVGCASAAERDIVAARRLNTELIRARRRENAQLLRKAFPEWLVFPELNAGDCPMFVPVLVPEGRRDALRRYLIEREIYCPVHWPVSALHRLDERERFLYDHELSLVCDQRYGPEDMDRMIRSIRQFRKEA